MNKSKLGVLTIITVLLLSFTIVIVAAQQAYQTEKTTNVTVGSDGTFTASESDVGISYEIQGTAGATGTVTADVYSGNPQATANIPAGVSLSHFVVITFDMNANDFISAKIVISYSDSDVSGISAPYAIYKYNDAYTNSYVALPSTVDTAAKTITVTVNSLSDPLFAIGGATATSGGIPTSTWVIIIVVSVIVIVLVAVFVVSRMRKPSGKSSDPEFSFKS